MLSQLSKKLTKIPSIQGGPFLTGSNDSVGVQRNIDLDIPAGMYINPSESFIQMRVNMQIANNVLSNVNIVSTANEFLPLKNTDLIRNCWMDMEKGGRAEDLKRVNKLRRNLNQFLSTGDQKQNKPDALNSSLQDYATARGISPFLEIHAGDGFQSTFKDVYLRVKLSELYELGNLQYLNTQKTGKIRLHLELEKKNYFSLFEREELLLTDSELMTDVEQFTENPESTDTFYTQVVYPTMNYFPWYNGQSVLVSYRYISGFDASENPIFVNVGDELHTILSTSDSADLQQNPYPDPEEENFQLGTIKITLDRNLDNESANGNFDNIAFSIFRTDPQDTAEWSILTTELVLCEYNQPQPSMDFDDLSYTTFTTEEFSNNHPSLSHIFELEPNAVNVLLMFDNGSPPQPISNYNDKFTYRLRTNDQDLVDYDTLVNNKIAINNGINHHALHYDMLGKTFINMSKQMISTLPALSMIAGRTNEGFFNKLDNRVLILGSPLPLTQDMKRFQVVIENQEDDPSNIDNIILFKHCVKMIKL
jgi:hypothetical protein